MTCDCIERINDKLQEKNLRLTGFAFELSNFNTVPTVSTEWIDGSKAPKGFTKKSTPMFASHCPFCGKPVRAAADNQELVTNN